MEFPESSKFILYARDSGGAEQDSSVLQQEAQFRSWCRENSYIPTKIFTDEARPGSTTAGRDGFDEMISYLRKGGSGEIGVVVWKYNRFAREIDDAQYFKADLRRRGFEIISLQDNIPSGPEGRLIEGIIDWMSQRQLMDMSSDIKRGLMHRVVNLRGWPGGKPPAGFILEREVIGTRRDGSPREISRLIPDPQTSHLAIRAFELRGQGATFSEILRECPIVGSPAALGRLLTNEIYIGVFHYANVTVRDFCAPLVNMAAWNAAQKVNRERQERHGYNHPRVVRSQFILTGLLRCARCGSPMHGRITTNSAGTRYSYYRCQSDTNPPRCGASLIPKAQIENMVIAHLLDTVLTPEFLDELKAEVEMQAMSGGGELDRKRERLQSKIHDLNIRIDHLISAIEEHGHSTALLKELGELEQAERDQRESLAVMDAEAQSRVIDLDFDTSDLARVARVALLSADNREKARVLRAFVKEIQAEKAGGEIRGEILIYFMAGAERNLSLH